MLGFIAVRFREAHDWVRSELPDSTPVIMPCACIYVWDMWGSFFIGNCTCGFGIFEARLYWTSFGLVFQQEEQKCMQSLWGSMSTQEQDLQIRLEAGNQLQKLRLQVLHLVQFLLNLTSINSRTTALLCAFVMYSLGVCVVAEAESGWSAAMAGAHVWPSCNVMYPWFSQQGCCKTFGNVWLHKIQQLHKQALFRDGGYFQLSVDWCSKPYMIFLWNYSWSSLQLLC